MIRIKDLMPSQFKLILNLFVIEALPWNTKCRGLWKINCQFMERYLPVTFSYEILIDKISSFLSVDHALKRQSLILNSQTNLLL